MKLMIYTHFGRRRHSLWGAYGYNLQSNGYFIATFDRLFGVFGEQPPRRRLAMKWWFKE